MIGTVKFLLERGADVKTGWNGMVPILQAAATAQPGIIELLLDHGADACHHCPATLHCALTTAILKFYKEEQPGEESFFDPVVADQVLELRKSCILKLIDRGAGINSVTNDGKTTLDNAIWLEWKPSFTQWLRDECGALRADELPDQIAQPQTEEQQ